MGPDLSGYSGIPVSVTGDGKPRTAEEIVEGMRDYILDALSKAAVEMEREFKAIWAAAKRLNEVRDMVRRGRPWEDIQ